jgi:hypothetical protein
MSGWHDRVILDERRDFIVELSYYEAAPSVLVPFIHLTVSYFSATVLRDLLTLWETLRPTLPPVLFAQGTVDDWKLERLVTKFGFQYLTFTPCDDGIDRRVFVNYLVKDK